MKTDSDLLRVARRISDLESVSGSFLQKSGGAISGDMTVDGSLGVTGEIKAEGNTVWHAGNLDYETGTWTPSLYGTTTAGSPTYNPTYRTGTYVKIGNLVHCFGCVRLTSIGGMVGNIYISGLPFPKVSGSAEGYRGAGSIGSAQNWVNTATNLLAIQSEGSTIRICKSGGVYITNSDITDNFVIYGMHFVYFTNS